MILTAIPAYLYYCEELPKRGDGALFHFTKFDSFLKILDDLTLLPSSFENLNDMNEGNINNMNMDKNFMVMYDAEKYIKEHCRLLCFSQNYGVHGFVREGSNHPAMWAHYADNSNGVCIVIDKDAFIKKNQSIFNTHFCKFEDVTYSIFNSPAEKEINYNASTSEVFILNNWKGLFFLKHKDWEYEDEHRLLIMGYDGKLSIDGCIKYIVLGRKIFLDKSNKKIKEILDRVVSPSSVCYQKFVPRSFATTCYNNQGYSTFEIAYKILEVVKQNISDKLYADYSRWLTEEFSYSPTYLTTK